jgi:diguanylate cyclase (GGDEF)-like protein
MLLLLPTAMLATVAAYLVVNPAKNKYTFVTYVTVVVTLSTLGALEAGGLTLLLLRERAHRRRLLREREAAEKTAQFTKSRVESLEEELNRLSAVREVYRAGRLEQALGESLRTVRELARAEEVGLFLLEVAGEKLAPHALADASGAYVHEQLAGRTPDDEGVEECFEQRALYQTALGERLRVLVPLTLEGRTLGVLAATLRVSGDAESQEQFLENTQAFLQDVAPHVASVVNTTLLRTQAIADGLTTLFNRAHFDRVLEEQVALARRRGRPLTLVMVDLDHFKSVNDAHGHQAGDEVLTVVASIIKGNMRSYDTAYRYGGEELALLLPETAEASAQVLVERVRRNVKRHSFRGAQGEGFSVTLSAGIAQFDRVRMAAPQALVARADAALYRAKQAGRDRVELGSALPGPETPSAAPPAGGRRPRKPEKERD